MGEGKPTFVIGISGKAAVRILHVCGGRTLLTQIGGLRKDAVHTKSVDSDV